MIFRMSRNVAKLWRIISSNTFDNIDSKLIDLYDVILQASFPDLGIITIVDILQNGGK